jgi:hypothetical protein
MHLMNYNYPKCIHHGKILLNIHTTALNEKDGVKPLEKNTIYNTHLYLSESYCMLGKFQEALESLEKAEGVCQDYDKPIIK